MSKPSKPIPDDWNFDLKSFNCEAFLRSIEIYEAPTLVIALNTLCHCIFEDKVPELLRTLTVARYCFTAKWMSDVESLIGEKYTMDDIFKITKSQMKAAVRSRYIHDLRIVERYMLRVLYIFVMTYPTFIMKCAPEEVNHGN